MATTSGAVDWASRPVPTAMSPELLAAFVDGAISRTDGLLFTATSAEELDEIGRWQQLKDQAFAGQVRAIVAAYNRAGVEEREFAADEVGLAIGATSTTGAILVGQALGLAALPGLLEAVESGQLTERHVLAALRELDKVDLTIEQRQAVVLVMLARYRNQTPGELAALVARLIVQVDRAAAAARDAKAAASRKVWFSRDVDGQALLLARGPAEAIAAIRASLEATLAADVDADDERSRDAREFDLLVDLLTGGERAGSWQAEIPGLGPILPSTARDLLDQCDSLTPITVDDSGAVIAVGDAVRQQAAMGARTSVLRKIAAPPSLRDLTGSGYRFPPRLRRFLEALDRTCVFPGCGRPARRTDKDHRRPWPDGTPAPTTASACADITTAPSTPSSPSPSTPTAATGGPAAVAGSSADIPRASDPLSQPARPNCRRAPPACGSGMLELRPTVRSLRFPLSQTLCGTAIGAPAASTFRARSTPRGP